MALNRPGVAYHLTAVVPVRADRQPELPLRLGELADLRPSPFAQLPATHYVRLAPFSHLGASRPGEHIERLHAGYLLTSIIFDGDPDRYLLALARRCRQQVEDIWGCCEGCPPAGDATAFAAWLRGHELAALHCFATIPDATAPRIRAALSLRRRLIRFAVATQDCAPAGLRRAYLDEFGER
jgi:hypothetical protein